MTKQECRIMETTTGVLIWGFCGVNIITLLFTYLPLIAIFQFSETKPLNSGFIKQCQVKSAQFKIETTASNDFV